MPIAAHAPTITHDLTAANDSRVWSNDEQFELQNFDEALLEVDMVARGNFDDPRMWQEELLQGLYHLRLALVDTLELHVDGALEVHDEHGVLGHVDVAFGECDYEYTWILELVELCELVATAGDIAQMKAVAQQTLRQFARMRAHIAVRTLARQEAGDDDELLEIHLS